MPDSRRRKPPRKPEKRSSNKVKSLLTARGKRLSKRKGKKPARGRGADQRGGKDAGPWQDPPRGGKDPVPWGGKDAVPWGGKDAVPWGKGPGPWRDPNVYAYGQTVTVVLDRRTAENVYYALALALSGVDWPEAAGRWTRKMTGKAPGYDGGGKGSPKDRGPEDPWPAGRRPRDVGR